MKTTFRLLFIGLSIIILLPSAPFAQDRFIDVRQSMADGLTAVKKEAQNGRWAAALDYFSRAKKAWASDVKPMIEEGVKTDSQFQEYSGRIVEVEQNLDALERLLTNQALADVEARVNAAIWAISHHPRGFSVPNQRYTAWDWVFGLGIGLGFCTFAIFAGLYLRRSYYRRYPKARFIK